ncbi:hypothetical protein TNCV_2689191 [Trichonephila clavipes]|nr:hypothetical protein TNCV_2689191 [Trichonephila clavipes]
MKLSMRLWETVRLLKKGDLEVLDSNRECFGLAVTRRPSVPQTCSYASHSILFIVLASRKFPARREPV